MILNSITASGAACGLSCTREKPFKPFQASFSCSQRLCWRRIWNRMRERANKFARRAKESRKSNYCKLNERKQDKIIKKDGLFLPHKILPRQKFCMKRERKKKERQDDGGKRERGGKKRECENGNFSWCWWAGYW